MISTSLSRVTCRLPVDCAGVAGAGQCKIIGSRARKGLFTVLI